MYPRSTAPSRSTAPTAVGHTIPPPGKGRHGEVFERQQRRFALFGIFIKAVNGACEPIIQSTPKQQSILNGVFWYPVRWTFDKIAHGHRHMTFVAATEPSPVIGLLFVPARRLTDKLGHLLLLFFIFTTYLPAPVFGFGWTLAIFGFTLVKGQNKNLTWAYGAAFVAILLYQAPWRDWVLGHY